MRRLQAGCLGLFMCVGVGVASVQAGPNANAKILIHLLSPTTKNACTRTEASPACSGIVTAGALYPHTYFAYLLVTDGDATAGVAGVQCGINYNGTPNAGVDVYSWTNCATLEFTSTGWPASGGGNLITWDTTTRCQRFEPGGSGTGVTAVAGYFYCAAYGADTVRVTPRTVDLAAKVSACDGREDIVASEAVGFTPSHLGSAVFSPSGVAVGHNPCGQLEDTGSTSSRVSPDGIWTRDDSSVLVGDVTERYPELVPTEHFTVYDGDLERLRVLLAGAPEEGSLPATLVYLPMFDGAYHRFYAWESSLLSESLPPGSTSRFYVVRGVDHRHLTGRIALVGNTAEMSIFGDAIACEVTGASQESPAALVAFDISQIRRDGFQCRFVEADPPESAPFVVAPHELPSSGQSPGMLSNYRLAIQCTGEVTEYFGDETRATQFLEAKASQLSALFEHEAGIRFSLSFAKAWPDKNLDPFVTFSVQESQSSLDTSPGNGAYDLGILLHRTFSIGGEAGAEPGICQSLVKGQTVIAHPYPDRLEYFQFIAHEVGHQLGASHTRRLQNNLGVTCCGVGLKGVEPGSGSTLMGDPDGCTPACIIQPEYDSYFHGWNVEQMLNTRALTTSCATLAGDPLNLPPIADAGPDFAVPLNTPFRLTAGALPDPNGDVLFYSWEQYDPLSPPPPPQIRPLPLFRSRPPTTVPSRYFPKLDDVLNPPAVNQFESLPVSPRDINFRLTVRDRHVGGGAVAFDDVVLHFAGEPFRVTFPNGLEAFSSGDSIEVTWDVGGGSGSAVDILFLNNGFEYAVLSANVPNSGSAWVHLPSINTVRGRVLIRPIGQVYYDVSDTDFIVGDVSAVDDEPSRLRAEPLISLLATPNPVAGRVRFRVLVQGRPWGEREVTKAEEQLTLRVVEIQGREVACLYRGAARDFPGEVEWQGRLRNGQATSAGVFFALISIGGQSRGSVKFLLTR